MTNSITCTLELLLFTYLEQCTSDPLPTRLLKKSVDVLAPFLIELYNRSMSMGVVPAVFKAALRHAAVEKS